MRIGILAVQGDYEAHARMLERLDADYHFVRTPQDVANAEAIVLPGGESTTMLKFLQEEGLEQPLRNLAARGGAFLATCAGAILLAREVRGPAQWSLGLADLTVTRNAYGRQLASEVRYAPSKLKPEPLEMVFIRAPLIEEVGPLVEVLASENGHPVLVRQGKMLAATFHPELSNDTAVHEYFLKLAAQPPHPAPVAGVTGSAGSKAPRPRNAGKAASVNTSAQPLTRVLFVCLGNACRSPMAEALARHLASDVIEASSAGVMALGHVPAPTHAVLKEGGVPSHNLASKPLRAIDLSSVDLVVNLAGRSIKKELKGQALPMEDWDVGDPFGSDLEIYRKIRDEIERRVIDLAARLRPDKSTNGEG